MVPKVSASGGCTLFWTRWPCVPCRVACLWIASMSWEWRGSNPFQVASLIFIGIRRQSRKGDSVAIALRLPSMGIGATLRTVTTQVSSNPDQGIPSTKPAASVSISTRRCRASRSASALARSNAWSGSTQATGLPAQDIGPQLSPVRDGIRARDGGHDGLPASSRRWTDRILHPVNRLEPCRSGARHWAQGAMDRSRSATASGSQHR